MNLKMMTIEEGKKKKKVFFPSKKMSWFKYTKVSFQISS